MAAYWPSSYCPHCGTEHLGRCPLTPEFSGVCVRCHKPGHKVKNCPSGKYDKSLRPEESKRVKLLRRQYRRENGATHEPLDSLQRFEWSAYPPHVAGVNKNVGVNKNQVAANAPPENNTPAVNSSKGIFLPYSPPAPLGYPAATNKFLLIYLHLCAPF